VAHALATRGLPWSPNFVGSIEEFSSDKDSGGQPFGVRFLTTVTARPGIMTDLRYDPEKQQAVSTVTPPQAGKTSATTYLYDDTSLDGVVIRDLAFDKGTD
jgi:hypothetical protein